MPSVIPLIVCKLAHRNFFENLLFWGGQTCWTGNAVSGSDCSMGGHSHTCRPNRQKTSKMLKLAFWDLDLATRKNGIQMCQKIIGISNFQNDCTILVVTYTEFRWKWPPKKTRWEKACNFWLGPVFSSPFFAVERYTFGERFFKHQLFLVLLLVPRWDSEEIPQTVV